MICHRLILIAGHDSDIVLIVKNTFCLLIHRDLRDCLRLLRTLKDHCFRIAERNHPVVGGKLHLRDDHIIVIVHSHTVIDFVLTNRAIIVKRNCALDASFIDIDHGYRQLYRIIGKRNGDRVSPVLAVDLPFRQAVALSVIQRKVRRLVFFHQNRNRPLLCHAYLLNLHGCLNASHKLCRC